MASQSDLHQMENKDSPLDGLAVDDKSSAVTANPDAASSSVQDATSSEGNDVADITKDDASTTSNTVVDEASKSAVIDESAGEPVTTTLKPPEAEPGAVACVPVSEVQPSAANGSGEQGCRLRNLWRWLTPKQTADKLLEVTAKPDWRETLIHGHVEPGFEAVRDEFVANFERRGEVGAAVAVYYQGHKVVDLWGGYKNRPKQEPFEAETLVKIASTTKGIASLAVAMQISRGLLALDERVCTYWPDFAQNGKQDVTVRQLISHECGLGAIDEACTPDLVGDPERLFSVIAKQKMEWDTPGEHHGYMVSSLGFYVSALVYFTDPQKRTIGKFINDEICLKAGCQDGFYLGLPESVSDDRLAVNLPVSVMRLLLDIDKLPLKLARDCVLLPKSYPGRTALNPPADIDWNDRKNLVAEYAGGNGMSTARALAAIYSAAERAINTQGRENVLGLSSEMLSAMQEMKAPSYDQVLHCPTSFSVGFSKPGPISFFGSDSRAFGTSGMGGHHAHADPSTESSFAYLQLNEQPTFLDDDPRERALRVRTYECIAALREASGLSKVPLEDVRRPSILNAKFLRRHPKLNLQ